MTRYVYPKILLPRIGSSILSRYIQFLTNASLISNTTLPPSTSTNLTDAKSLTTQSGSALKTCSTVWLVTTASTLQPASLPARIPAGLSSSTSTFLSALVRLRRSRPRA